MLRLGPLGKASAEVQRFNLALDKANYGGNVRNLTLERQQDSYLFTPFELGTSVTSKQIREILGQDGEWLEATKSTIVERFGVAESTARRAINKAEYQNLIQREKKVNKRTGRKKTYLTTDAGNEG